MSNLKLVKRYELMAELRTAFPLLWIKTSEEFNLGDRGAIWTGEGSEVVVTYDGDTFTLPVFDFYDDGDGLYTSGVYCDLAKFLRERGWHCEFHDAGTVFIYNDRE